MLLLSLHFGLINRHTKRSFDSLRVVREVEVLCTLLLQVTGHSLVRQQTSCVLGWPSSTDTGSLSWNSSSESIAYGRSALNLIARGMSINLCPGRGSVSRRFLGI